MATDETSKRDAAPPYVSYSTFKTFVGALKEHVVPNRIDRSTLGRFSGGVQNQLMAALKFLALMDADGRPSAALRGLADKYNTDEWSIMLATVLAQPYEALFKLQLATASPQEFNTTFLKSFACEGETARKGIAFFLNAGKDAGINFSPYLLKGIKPRSGTPRKKPKNSAPREAKGAYQETNSAADGIKPKDEKSDTKTIEGMLLSKFPEFDPSWSKELQQHWFEAYQKLLSMRDSK